MARRVNVEIRLENGKKLSHYHWLRIDQRLFAHNTFEIAIPVEMLESKGESFFNQAHQDVCGKTITVSFRPVAGSGNFDFLFKGIVTGITLNHSGSLTNSYVLKGYSPTILLEDCQMRRIFLKKSLPQIVDKVLAPYPGNLLKRQIKPTSSNEMKYISQYDESNFHLLKRLAAQCGEWLYYDGRELRLGKPEEGKKVEFKIDGSQTFKLAMVLHPIRFRLHRYNYLNHEIYGSSADGQSVPGLSTFGSFALQESNQLFSQISDLLTTQDIQEKGELDETLKGIKATRANQLILFEGIGETPNLTLGTIIDVCGSKPASSKQEDYGKYRITEIQHEVNSNGIYQNNFQAVPEKTEYPPVPSELLPPRGYPEFAEVIDNQDPEKLGRVRVRFLWPGSAGACETDWLRVALPYTGNGSGMLFVPEEGAQVLVDYEAGMAELPLVVGSLYHPHAHDPPEEGYTYDTNALKAIQTKGGNRITLQDQEGGKKIALCNTKQDKARIILSFEEDGNISIETGGKLLLKANDIDLEAQNNLRLKGDTIELTALGEIALQANQVNLQADTTTKIEAQAKLKLSAASVELAGQASTKVSGATVDVAGQALVNVNAALVKIN